MANEKRLIDANALIEMVGKRLKNPLIFNWLCSFVKDAPTVDAVEVVHGEWGEIYTCHGERLWGYKCSQCEYDNSKKTNFCPNCGAKMDGDGNG